MEQTVWGFWLPILLGGIQTVYTVLGYYRDKQTKAQGALTMKRPYVVMGILLVLTWAAVGFNYYACRQQGTTWAVIPQIFTHYGTISDGKKVSGCQAGVNTDWLLDFQEKYEVALACGIQDRRVDMFNQTKMTISALFAITGQVVEVIAQYRKEMLSELVTKKQDDITSLWMRALLIPKGVDVAVIHRLSDVEKYGGKIVDEDFLLKIQQRKYATPS